MPSALLYLGIMLVVIIAWFVLLKRPVYEAVLISFIVLPFALDYAFKDNFFTDRLGAAGAKQRSNFLLLFIAGISSIYACLISKDKKFLHFPSAFHIKNHRSAIFSSFFCSKETKRKIILVYAFSFNFYNYQK